MTPQPQPLHKGKYQVLQYEKLEGFPLTVHTVKVTRTFLDANGNRIVRYRYNWPFPIDKDVSETEFKSWIVEEEK